MSIDLRSRIRNIRQDTRWAKEDIVLDDGSRIDRHVVLYFHVVADQRAAINVHVLPNHAARADASSLHHVGEVPNLRARTYLAPLVNKS
jgi:hypothetical protein